MTREECIALLERYAEYHGMGIPNLAGCREAMKMAADLLSQPSLPSDLDEAAEEYNKQVIEETKCHHNALTYAEGYEDALLLIPDAFIAGAKWQAEQFLKSSPLPEDTTIFLKGVAEGKRLMMEEAVEGIAEELYNDGEIHCAVGVGTCFQPGQKVYVIKKEEQK